MEELLKTNDPVLITAVEAYLKGEGIACFIADTHMSILDGSIGILPRRILVDHDDIDRARRIIKEAGLWP
ncbi:MAG: DUF2007 domain-containing protein [Hyphomicrobiaceae bacterium]|nr:DUF2007 domain-containing protein [Hyphomicrobiaceae bacterium]